MLYTHKRTLHTPILVSPRVEDGISRVCYGTFFGSVVCKNQ